ncbi:MAG: energy-coupled thiamine transporter ThiT [Bacilli bacterium]|jgi:thiamine transporter
MKKIKFDPVIVSIVLGFSCYLMFFLPLIVVGGADVFSFSLLFGISGTKIAPLLYFTFTLILVSPILLILKKYYAQMPFLVMVLNILAGIMLILSVDFTKSSFGETEIMLSSWSIVFSCALFVSSLILLIIASNNNQYSVYDIVESAMLIALAIGLDLPSLKIQLGANGGSISFTMIPLFILALRQGPVKGLLGCGIVYGFITCILDNWGLFSFPFDYLLGYGSIAIMGFFNKLIFAEDNKKMTIKGICFIVLGSVLAITGRLLSSTLSGIIFYEMKSFWDSLIYNAIYILPSGAIVIISLIALYKPLLLINSIINKRFSK